MDLKLFELGLHVVRSMECELAVRQQNTLDAVRRFDEQKR